MPSSPLAPFAVALVAALGVAACSAPEDKFAPACPALSLLRDASDVTRFAGSSRDPNDIVLHARITSVPASCRSDTATRVAATLNVTTEVTRGPAGAGAPVAGAPVALTYFLALTEGERVVREHDFPLTVRFTGNTDRLSIAGDDIELLLPVSKAKSAAAYHVYVGFRLTPEELAYNRTHRTP